MSNENRFLEVFTSPKGKKEIDYLTNFRITYLTFDAAFIGTTTTDNSGQTNRVYLLRVPLSSNVHFDELPRCVQLAYSCFLCNISFRDLNTRVI